MNSSNTEHDNVEAETNEEEKIGDCLKSSKKINVVDDDKAVSCKRLADADKVDNKEDCNTPAKTVSSSGTGSTGDTDNVGFYFNGIKYNTYQEMVNAKRKINENWIIALELMQNRRENREQTVRNNEGSGSEYKEVDSDTTLSEDNFCSVSRTAKTMHQKETLRNNKRKLNIAEGDKNKVDKKKS